MSEETSKKNWLLYAGVAVALAIVFYLAIFEERWYRAVVLAALLGLSGFVVYRFKQLEELLEEKGSVAVIREVEDEDEVEKTKANDLRTLEQKEFELQKLDLDRTQIFEDLLSQTALEEADKSRFREKIQEADKETSKVREEWLNASNRMMSMVSGAKRMFVKESPMKEMAASIDERILDHGSFQELNQEIQRLVPRLSKESKDALAKTNYVDEDNQLTRSGYKALLQASEEE
ncbi:hypothetical protein [Shouchella shacheensis]|uniref:hypothetical protein n=1 Tax=Shouchella shacheensis TaxID=1649580 RepID=UPI0012FC66A0|nr:hypothetical protein [Shouchella shacheensis]